jgi:hypothetical protein
LNSKLASLETALNTATQNYEAQMAQTQAAMSQQQAQLEHDTRVSKTVASSLRQFVPQGMIVLFSFFCATQDHWLTETVFFLGSLQAGMLQRW